MVKDTSMEVFDSLGMENLGSILCKALQKTPEIGMIIYLSGPLGAGKTTLVRGFLRAMEYEGIVKSPTYTLVEPYEFPHKTIYHFDFYRLQDPQELEWMGIRDYFQKGSDCLVEWPEKAMGFIPSPDLHIHIQISEKGRTVTLTANSDRGRDVLPTIHN